MQFEKQLLVSKALHGNIAILIGQKGCGPECLGLLTTTDKLTLIIRYSHTIDSQWQRSTWYHNDAHENDYLKQGL